jgi:hypothetical protein
VPSFFHDGAAGEFPAAAVFVNLLAQIQAFV